jgi:RecA-family ATPase
MPKSLISLAGRVRPPADWIIPHLLKRRNTAFIIGEPKRALKSWLLFNLGWDLAEGKNVWGILDHSSQPVFQPPRAMRVVYFSQEDTEDDLQDRYDVMTGAGRIPTPNFYYEPKDLNLAFDNGPGEAALKRSIEAAGPVDLVMFDPMRRMHYYSENDSESMQKIWRTLDSIQRTFDCACIFSHHVTKPSKDAGYSRTSPFAARGSTDIFGGADAFINVEPLQPKGVSMVRLINLYYETKRSAPLDPMKLSVDLGTGLVGFHGYI